MKRPPLPFADRGDLARLGAGACLCDTRDYDAPPPGEQATQIIVTLPNVGSIEDYTQPWGLVADLRIFRDRALGRQELKAIRRGVEATLPAAPAASDLVAPYDLTPGREYNAPPMDDY